MTTLIKTLAALATGTVLVTSSFAHSAEAPNSSQLVAVENEPAPKLTVGAPLPGPLARRVAVIRSGWRISASCR